MPVLIHFFSKIYTDMMIVSMLKKLFHQAKEPLFKIDFLHIHLYKKLIICLQKNNLLQVYKTKF